MAEQNKWAAPRINASAMWQMTADDFNAWRRTYDYPRIVSYLKEKQPEFQTWMNDQGVTDGLLIRHSPSTFFSELPFLYLHTVLEKGENEKEMLHEFKFDVGQKMLGDNIVTARKDIISYPQWQRKRTGKTVFLPSMSSRTGRSVFFGGLELLDMGACRLSDLSLLNKLLDFTNVSDLQILNCFNNSVVKLWFCFASNITITGDLAFVDAYESSFTIRCLSSIET